MQEKDNSKPKILYVEDDEVLSFVTKDNLELQGYSVDHHMNGKNALASFKSEAYDLCVLDVMLPEMDGYSLAKYIREMNTEIPIIFLTAKSLKEDKIFGLKLGADDYITKPYSIEELVLKIGVFLRRKHILHPNQLSKYNIGTYEFDFGNFKLELNGEVRKLTQREAELLQILVKNKNNIVARSKILETIWGQDDYFLGRSLDVFISRLRKYLRGDESIKLENVHGVGFRLIF